MGIVKTKNKNKIYLDLYPYKKTGMKTTWTNTQVLKSSNSDSNLIYLIFLFALYAF